MALAKVLKAEATDRVPITTYEPTLYFAKRQGRWQFARSGRARIS